MFYSRYLYEGVVIPGTDPERMARHTAYNVCSQLTRERRESPSWIEERNPPRDRE
jgi:hypothetical protein